MRILKPVMVAIYIVLSISLLSACGGGGSSSSQTQPITGGAIKGPLINATVTLYAFDNTKAGFKGSKIDSGTTDATAAITGLDLPLPSSPPYIMEFTSTASTRDITTDAFPLIATLSTVLTQAMIDSNEPVYATPLTTLALAVAINRSTNTTTATAFLAELTTAANEVVATVGFGMPASIDIFTTPPLVDNAVDTTQKLSDVLAYRTAIEALAAIVFQMQEHASTSATAEDIFMELAMDLADGLIDAKLGVTASTVYTPATLTAFIQDPASLDIPGEIDGKTVAQVAEILVSEAGITGSTADITELNNKTVTTIIQAASTTPVKKAVWNQFNWSDGTVWR